MTSLVADVIDGSRLEASFPGSAPTLVPARCRSPETSTPRSTKPTGGMRLR